VNGTNEICSFSATIVPELLQTADYARAVFADGGELSPKEQESIRFGPGLRSG